MRVRTLSLSSAQRSIVFMLRSSASCVASLRMSVQTNIRDAASLHQSSFLLLLITQSINFVVLIARILTMCLPNFTNALLCRIHKSQHMF